MEKDTVFGSQDHPKVTGEHVGKKPLTLVATVFFTPRGTFHAADTLWQSYTWHLHFWLLNSLKEMGLPCQTHKHKKNRDWKHRIKEEEKISYPGDDRKSKKLEKREDRIINISGEEKYKMEV